jgi:two-component system, sensor histidine kinase LadS
LFSLFRLRAACFIFFYGLFTTVFAFAQSPVSPLLLLKAAEPQADLHGKMLLLDDTKGDWSLKNVLSQDEKWVVQKGEAIPFGYSNTYHWIKLSVKNTDIIACDWVWELDIAAVQHVEMYQISGDTVVKSITTGIDYPFRQRWEKHRLLLFPVRLQAQESTTFLLRLHNKLGSVNFLSHLYTKDRWQQIDTKQTAAWTLFYTLMVLGMLVSLCLGLIFKDRIYGFYLAYIICVTLFMASNSGFSFAYLYPESPTMAFYAKIYWLLGVAAFLLNFQYHLLHRVVSKSTILRYGVYTLSAFFTLFFLIVTSGASIDFLIKILPIAHFINTCTMIWILVLLIYSIKANYRPAYYFLLAVSPVLLVGILMMLRNYKFMEITCLRSQFTMPTVFTLELFFFFFALLNRINELRRAERNQLRAEQELRHDRNRISRDLHDNVGAHLSQIIAGLDMLSQKENSETNSINNLKTLSQTTITQLRETIWAMHTESINASDFADKLVAYTVQQTRLKPELTLKIGRINEDEMEAIVLSPMQALNLYRIAQEAINNSLKYAQATRLDLVFDAQKPQFSIIIKDNGIGFDPNDSAKQNSYGLQNMQFRAKEINAKYNIVSEIGEGTIIHLAI